MKSGLKKFLGVTMVSGILSGGAASVGVSATSDVETKMNAMTDYVNLVGNMLLNEPTYRWDGYVEKAKSIAKRVDKSYAWWTHCNEREEWKKAYDLCEQVEKKLESNDGLNQAFCDWLKSNNLPD